MQLFLLKILIGFSKYTLKEQNKNVCLLKPQPFLRRNHSCSSVNSSLCYKKWVATSGNCGHRAKEQEAQSCFQIIPDKGYKELLAVFVASKLPAM